MRWKTRRAKVSELELELESVSTSAVGGGGWESTGDIPVTRGIGGSTLAESQRGGSMTWN
jgi:hypothetical protein